MLQKKKLQHSCTYFTTFVSFSFGALFVLICILCGDHHNDKESHLYSAVMSALPNFNNSSCKNYKFNYNIAQRIQCLNDIPVKNVRNCLFLFATGSLGKRSCYKPLNKAVHHPQVTKMVKIILERCAWDRDENETSTG